MERSRAGRRGRTGNLDVLQMRRLHNDRPELCPILLTPKGATGNRLDAQGKHLRILDLLVSSATGASIAWGRVAAQGMELLTAARPTLLLVL